MSTKCPKTVPDTFFTVSIVIATLNEAARIGRAVDRAWATAPAEVIVVDGGSCDSTPQIAAEHGAQIVCCDAGRALQQNVGAQHARGDILLFLHADNWLEPTALRQINAAAARRRPCAGAFRQRIEADGFSYRLLEFGNALRARWIGRPYGDQAIFLGRDLFTEVGGFPEVPLMEDVLLMRKICRRTRPVLLPGPVFVSARRWQRHGIVRQTLRNWLLVTAHRFGVAPETLAPYYAADHESTA